ncbi:MAG: hypothetical protein KF841_05390 [Phycisphaerae bacterium]|nr:hypothetical protein [Phycisphaerae bacterium]
MASPAGAEIRAKLLRTGLFAAGDPIVRLGCTSFVEVELAFTGKDPFEGELRVALPDRDGDIATAVQPLGGLTPDGTRRKYHVYFHRSVEDGSQPVAVRLYNSAGDLVKMRTGADDAEVPELVSPACADVPSPDDYLIVDLTSPLKLPHANCLDTSARSQNGLNLRYVLPLAPRDLPLYWQGLESVDAIIWDDADPSDLSERQLTALVEWVKNGGSLLITAGNNWQALAKSSLADYLPVTLKGVTRVTEAVEFTRDIVKRNSYATRLSKAYRRNPINRCDMIRRPDAIGIPSDARGLTPIAYRSLLGRGNLTFVGASLRELMPAPAAAGVQRSGGGAPGGALDDEATQEFRSVCEKILALNFLALPPTSDIQNPFLLARTGLFDQVAGTISFRGLGFAFLMFAVVFAVLYLLAAGGSHYFMKKRGWQQYSWTAFALVSLAATLLGLIMIWSLRGISTKVRQTTVVDAHAGHNFGYATAYYGVKTPDHTRIDLRLPVGFPDVDPRQYGPIRTLPRSNELNLAEQVYVGADSYRVEASATSLVDVPVRATLKEFTGRWHGPIGGTLDARFVVEPGAGGRFGLGSYITNNLASDLHNCVILEGRQEIAGEGGSVLTRCLQLGYLPRSGEGATLNDEALAQRLYFQPPDPASTNREPIPLTGDALRLTHQLLKWNRVVTSIMGGADVSSAADRETAALLLLSLDSLNQTGQSGQTILSRSFGRSLNCAHLITRETAVLIGFAYEAPPAPLEINRSRRIPESSLTMYRFVIPVVRPARATSPENELRDTP